MRRMLFLLVFLVEGAFSAAAVVDDPQLLGSTMVSNSSPYCAKASINASPVITSFMHAGGSWDGLIRIRREEWKQHNAYQRSLQIQHDPKIVGGNLLQLREPHTIASFERATTTITAILTFSLSLQKVNPANADKPTGRMFHIATLSEDGRVLVLLICYPRS